jgi:hypothetical protein
VNGPSWNWIALMATAPFAAGLAVAFPVWRTKEIVLGNLAGSAVIFIAALALILRESAEIDRVTRACLDAGFVCWPDPSAFTRYAIYAGIGLGEVIALFILSLKVEKKIRNQQYAPEWRSG